MKQIPALWFVLHVACALCKAQAARLEFAQPGVHPASWYGWAAGERGAYQRVRDSRLWWLIVDSGGYVNGVGENLGEVEALRYWAAFGYPRTYARVHSAGLKGDAGFCPQCDVPYCARHWRAAVSGEVKCPLGHGS
ncbi:hypothetical protein ACIRO1_23725 [Streptomyces sp. NPDC102381]|uniref:hypothetical protein n=1 Tax=Streptomyces sp. NPDC102381 TaxID=3366164 RepID=UPI0037F6106C